MNYFRKLKCTANIDPLHNASYDFIKTGEVINE